VAARAGIEDVALDRAGQGGGERIAEGEVGVGRLLPGFLPHATVGRIEEAVEVPLRQPHGLASLVGDLP
jgi:hypothetical protein